MRSVEVFAFQILDATGGTVGIKQNTRGQRFRLDVQHVRPVLCNLQYPLTCPDALVPCRRERGVAQTLEAARSPGPRVWIRLAVQPAQNAGQGVLQAPRETHRGLDDRCHQRLIAQGLQLFRALGMQPTIPTMTGWVESE